MTAAGEVTVLISGLMALIPQGPAANRGDGLVVLWLDAQVEEVATDGCRIPPHRPEVVFSPDECHCAPDADGVCQCTTKAEKCRCILNSDAEVRFPLDYHSATLTKADLERELTRFPSMGNLARRAAKLKPAPGLKALLAGHAELAVNRLKARPGDSEPFYQCNFGPLTAGDGVFPHNQEVAELLEVGVSVKAMELTLFGVGFKLAGPEVHFINETIDDAVSARCRIPEEGPFLGRDFELFYNLAADWPPSRHFNRVIPRSCKPVPTGTISIAASGRPICTMSVFSE